VTALENRLRHILESIAAIRAMLAGRTIEEVADDIAVKPAFERYLEIISEASRHLPLDMKQRHGPDIPWKQVATLGNLLRHSYHHTNLTVLWSIYTDDLGPLEDAVSAMLAEFSSKGF
jgi:uncharacterized protein with HEPN domain